MRLGRSTFRKSTNAMGVCTKSQSELRATAFSFTPGFSQVFRGPWLARNRLNGFLTAEFPQHLAEARCE